jgi:prepilin-type N-terminal cleavage/methylation domain-containing protein
MLDNKTIGIWIHCMRSRFLMGSGFTLAELLVALAILGVIATFAIPKVLQAQQDQRYNATAKEFMAAVENAYQQHQLNGLVTTATTPHDLAIYFNYISRTTSGSIDYLPGGTTYDCTVSVPCYKLANGSIFTAPSTLSFSGNSSTHAIVMLFDPDGKVTDGGATNGPAKSVAAILYYNGRITSRGQMQIACHSQVCPVASTPDPSWFIW